MLLAYLGSELRIFSILYLKWRRFLLHGLHVFFFIPDPIVKTDHVTVRFDIVRDRSRWIPWTLLNPRWLLASSLWDRDKKTNHAVETALLTFSKKAKIILSTWNVNGIQKALCFLTIFKTTTQSMECNMPTCWDSNETFSRPIAQGNWKKGDLFHQDSVYCAWQWFWMCWTPFLFYQFDYHLFPNI